MKIGIFDSGLGGLFVAKALKRKLGQYDFVYLGDTERVPYGNRSHATIHKFLKEAVDFLFKKDCQLIIVACNTASSTALRKIQQEYLPKKYPGRRVLGVIIPTAETAIEEFHSKNVGVLGTEATINSKAYERELKKLDKKVKITSVASPLLVPMIESGQYKKLDPVLKDYLKPFNKVESLILGCTHYGIIKPQIQKIIGKKIQVITQTDSVPIKLKNYLKRHPEIDKKLSKKRQMEFYVTDITKTLETLGQKWFGKHINFKLTSLNN
jgi:glutamate racemase